MHLNKTALLLDMNSTFMFGGDNFGSSENFAEHYHRIGGKLPTDDINEIIRYIYNYLDVRYPNPKYRECFPSIESAILNNPEYSFSAHELQNIIYTFAQHEIGSISSEYVNVLHKLSTKFKLAVVIDIWAPKDTWLNLFEELGIGKLFIAASYSSDHGMVKPSPKPFNRVIAQLNVGKEQCLMIGDSVRRDFGGAEAAGIDCVLVGGANHINAAGCYKNLLEFSYEFI